MFLYGYVHMSAVADDTRRQCGIPGAGVGGSCELPDVGAGKQTQVLCKSRMHSTAEPSLAPDGIWIPIPSLHFSCLSDGLEPRLD